MNQRGRQLDLLLISFGKRFQLSGSVLFHAHALQPVLHSFRGLSLFHAPKLRQVHKLLGDGFFRVEASLLGKIADADLFCRKGYAVQCHRSLICGEYLHQNPERRGLSSSVPAKQA